MLPPPPRPLAAGLERSGPRKLPLIRTAQPLDVKRPTAFEDVPSLRYPLNRHMVSEKSAESVFEELQQILLQQNVTFSNSIQPLSVHCVWQGLLFDAEVVKIPRLNMHGIHFRRLKGDATAYKQLCTTLIELMQL